MATSFDPNAAAREGSGIFGLPHSAEDAHVVLVPVPFEATCSYGGGTVDGPAAILAASRQVDLHDAETGRPYERGIAMLPESAQVRAWNDEARAAAQPVIAAGGVEPGNAALEQAAARVDALCEKMNGAVHAEVSRLLDAGKVVGVVGGDHSTSLGAIQAVAARHPELGILHVDAHADLRRAFEGFTFSHASIMHNVMERVPAVTRLVQVGIRDLCDEEAERAASSNGRIRLHHDHRVAALLDEGQPWGVLVQRMIEPLPRDVYVSFDIDGLEPSLCPHTGTPVPGGLGFHQALALLRALGKSGRRIVGFDLNEVAPGPEGDEWDANVGARILYKLIGWTLRSRDGR